jgi:hypothetical protein
MLLGKGPQAMAETQMIMPSTTINRGQKTAAISQMTEVVCDSGFVIAFRS